MTTVKIQVYPGAIPALQDQVHPDGVPFRWLETLVEKIREIVAEGDQATCYVQNTNGLVVTYDKTLGPLEELQLKLATWEGLAHQARGLLPREGEMMTLDQSEALRKLLA